MTIAAPTEVALAPLKLPPPRVSGGRPFMETLAARRSSRDFDARPLDLPTLGDLLWAANGVNRTDSTLRTAPSARNRQELDVYVVTAEGAALYDPFRHELRPVATGDLRPQTGLQDFVSAAPVNLVYVADLARMQDTSTEKQFFYSALDAGCVSENVYLFCASAGLATVVRGWVDRGALAKALRLRPEQRIVVAQSIGYPIPSAASA
jgi:nitroreductase